MLCQDLPKRERIAGENQYLSIDEKLFMYLLKSQIIIKKF